MGPLTGPESRALALEAQSLAIDDRGTFGDDDAVAPAFGHGCRTLRAMGKRARHIVCPDASFRWWKTPLE